MLTIKESYGSIFLYLTQCFIYLYSVNNHLREEKVDRMGENLCLLYLCLTFTIYVTKIKRITHHQKFSTSYQFNKLGMNLEKFLRSRNKVENKYIKISTIKYQKYQLSLNLRKCK